MNNKKIFILGAGSMAKETLLIYKDLNKENDVVGFIENNNQSLKNKICGKIIYKSFESNADTKNYLFIGAIGSPKRKNWISNLEKNNYLFDSPIHPSALISDSVKIRSGVIICAHVTMTCDIKIGKHTIINIGTNIGHDCVIGNFVTIGPGVNLAGKVKIGDESWIGIGTTIIENVHIGKNTFIGAGSVVVNDIPDEVLAYGIPAKPIRKLTNSDWNKLI